MNDIALPQRETPDSLMLYGFWYRALPSERVSGNQLHKAMLLETPLAIGRDRQGRPFVGAAGSFPVLLLAIWGKRTNAWGALACMTTGFVVTALPVGAASIPVDR